MPKVSIIVPVYKAEKFLHRCVDSILAQTFTDWECILVDDGSPDGSGAICDEYAAKDARIKVIHKENGGVSSARNNGLSRAEGEWVTFVDSDDRLEGEIIGLIDQSQYMDELLVFDIIKEYDNQSVIEHIKPQVLYNRSFDKFLYKFINKTTFLAPWAKFFKMCIIKKYNIRFDEEIKWAEDRLFNITYLSHIKSIKFLGKGNYVYVEPSASDTIMKYHITPNMLIKLRDSIKKTIDNMSDVKHMSKTYTLLWLTMEKICILDKNFSEEDRKSFYRGNFTFQSLVDNVFLRKPINVVMYIFCALANNTRNYKFVQKYILKQ